MYVKDWGKEQPIVFSHGWPLSADAWEDQMFSLASRAYRYVAPDSTFFYTGGRAATSAIPNSAEVNEVPDANRIQRNCAK